MSNNLRTRNGMPFNFVNGLKVRGMDIESLIPGIEGIPEAGSKYQFAGNGSNKAFTLPVTPYNKDAVDVYVKQLYVHPDDYTLVGDTITLTEAPPAVVAGETYNVVIKVSLTTLNGYVNANRVSFEGENLDNILEKGKPLANYSALRAYAGAATQVRITDPGIAGFFYYDASDTSSADNGGTIIVSSNGKRWKRLFDGAVNVKWFGAKGDWNGTTGTDDTLAIQTAIDSTLPLGVNKIIYFPAGTYNVSKNLRIFNGQSLVGEAVNSTIIVKTTSFVDGYGTVPARAGTVTDNYNVDSVLSIIASANDFSRFNRIENLSFSRAVLGTNSYSIYAPRFAYATFKNVNIFKATYGIFSYQLFLVSADDIMAQACTNGFHLSDDGSGAGGSTTLTLKRFYFNGDAAVAEPSRGIFLHGLNYSNLISCGCDGLRPNDLTVAATAYWLSNCRGVNLDGCGTEGVRGFVIRVSGGNITVNGLRAGPIYGSDFAGTVAIRYIEGYSRVTFNNSFFDAVTTPGNIYNNVIRDGSHVTDINTPSITGGNSYIGYTLGSTWSQLTDGIWSTQNSATKKSAIYNQNSVTQSVIAAGSAAVAAGGQIDTGVTGGVSSKFVIVQVRTSNDSVPTVQAHVTESYSTGGLIKIRFTNISDGTQNYGTHTVNWCVMA